MVNPEMYHKARKDRIGAMKRMMHEMIAAGDEGPMSKSKVADVMDEAGEDPKEEAAETPQEEHDEDSGDTATPAHMDAFTKQKQEYFKPKMRPSRPGTAVMIGSLSLGKKSFGGHHGAGKPFQKKA